MSTDPRAPKLYRALLRLLPRRFRKQFGSNMEDVFASRLGESNGRLAVAWVWARATLDVLGAAVGERLSPIALPLGLLSPAGSRTTCATRFAPSPGRPCSRPWPWARWCWASARRLRPSLLCTAHCSSPCRIPNLNGWLWSGRSRTSTTPWCEASRSPSRP